MLDNAIEFVKNHGAVVEGQLKYLNDTDWSSITVRKEREAQHTLHVQLITSVIKKLENVVQEAGSELTSSELLKDFTKKISDEVTVHIDRADAYFLSENWQDYPDIESKSEEISFQDDILSSKLLFEKKLVKLNLNQEMKTIEIPIYGKSIISLPMREQIEERFPEIQLFIQKRITEKNNL